MNTEHSLVLIDKPAGITSFDVIRQLRRRTGIQKWGHAGTLDPAATGLLILAHGEGTKHLSEYVKLDKEYEAEIRLGVKTSTGDIEGQVLERQPVSAISPAVAARVLADMVGTLTLPVSAYSAIKKNGVPMYKRARAAAKTGQQITDVPLRDMRVYEAELLNMRAGAVLQVRFFVGSGTYVRSLAEEVGRRLGYPATLQRLRRTKIGDFSVAQATQL